MGNLWLLLAVAFFLAWGLWRSAPVLPADFWWHLRAGDDILATGVIPRVDSYSWTFAGSPFYDQPWLAQVLFAAVRRIGGIAGVVVVNGVAIAITAIVLARACVELTRDKRTTALVLILTGVPLMTHFWLVRPQTLAYPLFAAVVSVVLSGRVTVARCLAVLAVSAVWANVHGSFLLAPVVVLGGLGGHAAVMAVRRQWSTRDVLPQGLLLASAVVGTLINPRGVEIYGYVRQLTTNRAVRSLVDEWAPTSLGDASGRLLAVVVVATLIVVLLRRRAPDPVAAVLALGFLVLAATAYRHIVWFALAAMPAIADAFSSRDGTRDGAAASPVFGAAVLGAALLGVIVTLPWTRLAVSNLDGLEAMVPSDRTLAAVHDVAPQRLFNESGYGSYLIWHRVDVFFDPRFEFYPAEHVDEYISLSRGEDLSAATARWRFDAMLVSRSQQSRLATALHRSSEWALHAEDDDALLFVPAIHAP